MAFYISGGHNETIMAASEILLDGGNAFDAAIAALTTSFVVEPAMSSAGGGGFAMCKQKNALPVGLDFFCTTPNFRPDINKINIQPVEVNFGDQIETYYSDLGSIAVPGMIRGIFKLHKRFGSIPINHLFYRAIHVAKHGVPLNDFQHMDLGLLKNIFRRSARARLIFFDGEQVKPVGAITRLTYLGDFLDHLAREGQDLFYLGEVGQRLVQDGRLNGGVVNESSLAQYEARWVKPVSIPYKSHSVFTMGYPSIGGALLKWIINEISKFDLKTFRTPKFIEGWNDILLRGRQLQNDPESLFALMQMNVPLDDNRRGSTSHFNILDGDGNCIALTTTIGEGSGYFIPGTDIHMNNMLGEPGLLPKGINSWQPNRLMRSMMTPTITTDDQGHPQLIMGSGGAVRIPFVLAQVFSNLNDGQLDLQAAIDQPRMFHDGKTLHIEDASAFSTPSSLNCNKWTGKSLFFGGVNAILRQRGQDDYVAYGDKRRDGVELMA